MSDSASSSLKIARKRIATHYRVAESELLSSLIASINNYDNQFPETQRIARRLLEHLRSSQQGDWLSAFLNEYKLNNAEGIALLTLSEALLRVPDSTTTNLLLRDKLGKADWDAHRGRADSWLVNSATAGLSIAQSLLEDERGILGKLVARMGEPVVRNVALAATRLLADHFVLGETIDQAITRAHREQLVCSFDMLGEAARTKADAERYFNAYSQAIEKVGGDNSHTQHAISVKLSALYPRYEPLQHKHAISLIAERLHHLARLAAKHNLQLTVDAEESDRLEMSLQIFERVARRRELRDWQGMGLAVQAYQKRALPVVQWISELTRDIHKPVRVRLVKGAYWDSEVKRCQQAGLNDYPVFTRKTFTDASYLACAYFMLQDDFIYCAFATHNAVTVAQLLNWKQLQSKNKQIEFQRLHGMGAELYEEVRDVYNVDCRVYAPVGGHRELLAYLVRRMLENGANSSFVQQVRKDDINPEALLKDPVSATREVRYSSSSSIVLPIALFDDARVNSTGLDLSDANTLQQLDDVMKQVDTSLLTAAVITNATTISTDTMPVRNPANLSHIVGYMSSASIDDIDGIVRTAYSGHEAWSLTGVKQRAACLERTADQLQMKMQQLIALLISEAGKTRIDAMSEVREAIDFCRYYAVIAREIMIEKKLPGPTGETNTLSLASRGVFACISPWNFPLAIFVGQIAAALVTGNAVVAKPAPQTPLVAAQVTRILHEAGVPQVVLHLIPGGAQVGEALIAHPLIAGAVFTGSTATARRIAQTLLNDPDRPLVPLIAETGGINAMIVDSTALPEQVVNDVITSAFHSAGQRCSALRLLCLQEEIYETVLNMLQGAMDELRVGNPADEDIDIGPVIDATAQQKINHYIDSQQHRVRHQTCFDKSRNGYFVAPTVIELESPKELQQEIFGPVLHVARWKSAELPKLLNDINATGYGLTMGVHTRLESTIGLIRKHAHVGNLYVNRSMTGAVVGVQPFGGEGLSGTGFKAGGPHYLLRFCIERTVSIDTTAAGGNASLLSNQSE